MLAIATRSSVKPSHFSTMSSTYQNVTLEVRCDFQFSEMSSYKLVTLHRGDVMVVPLKHNNHLVLMQLSQFRCGYYFASHDIINKNPFIFDRSRHHPIWSSISFYQVFKKYIIDILDDV
jgi:hypothetical protein